jgi:mannose-6-phosphate isomerase-like protein (cupin superfamily)
VQEEVFVVLSGTLTMLLGEPPERVELPPQSAVAVEPKTPLQLRNDTDGEVVVFIYGAPPMQAEGQFFEDPEP